MRGNQFGESIHRDCERGFESRWTVLNRWVSTTRLSAIEDKTIRVWSPLGKRLDRRQTRLRFEYVVLCHFGEQIRAGHGDCLENRLVDEQPAGVRLLYSPPLARRVGA